MCICVWISFLWLLVLRIIIVEIVGLLCWFILVCFVCVWCCCFVYLLWMCVVNWVMDWIVCWVCDWLCCLCLVLFFSLLYIGCLFVLCGWLFWDVWWWNCVVCCLVNVVWDGYIWLVYLFLLFCGLNDCRMWFLMVYLKWIFDILGIVMNNFRRFDLNLFVMLDVLFVEYNVMCVVEKLNML